MSPMALRTSGKLTYRFILGACLALAQLAQADDAVDWLNRANQAAKALNYSGTYVYNRGEHSEVMRVSHLADGKGERNKIEVLDGPHREFIRINDQVFCRLSDGKTVRVERNALQHFFPSVVPDNPATLTGFYQPKLGGKDRVAERDCQVVILEARDSYRFTHVLWLDQATGLPLKVRTLNHQGAPLSVFAFSEIDIGSRPDKALFDVRMAGKPIQAAGFAAGVEMSSWQVEPPEGYTRTFEAIRPLPGRKNMVLHRGYSDGISSFSVFIEPVAQNDSGLEGLSTEGVMNIYSRRIDGFKVTALGEVPAAALLQTANSAAEKK